MMTREANRRSWIIAFLIAIALAWSVGLFGCSVRQQTIPHPPAIVSTQASFDGNVQNSGVIGPDNAGGFYVTPRFIARYDSLLVKYGERLSPPLKSGDRNGITADPPGNDRTGAYVARYQVTAEMIARFRTMNLWRKADL